MVFSQRTVVQADARRPHGADFFQVDGRMPWIRFEKLKVFVGQLTDGFRQLAVVEPEFGRGEMVQSGVERPAS